MTKLIPTRESTKLTPTRVIVCGNIFVVGEVDLGEHPAGSYVSRY